MVRCLLPPPLSLSLPGPPLNLYLVPLGLDNMPQCLWIWEVERLRLRVLAQQSASIRVARWSPTRPGLLAFVCGGNNVYLWTERNGCECVEVPTGK